MADAEDPVRVPPAMITYAEEHNIFNLMKDMLTSLVIDQPEDPISYMITLLKRDKIDIPQVLLLGPPGVGKHTVAKRLSAELTAVHVSTETLLPDASEVPSPDVLVKRIQHRLKETDCFNRCEKMFGMVQIYGRSSSKQNEPQENTRT